jgi:hypothetical protein
MSKVKQRYGEITQAAKKAVSGATEAAKKTDTHKEEARLFAKFQKRAREDFSSLNAGLSSGSRR